MQEEEKKIEPMVDIDTSGPGADIELPEEKPETDVETKEDSSPAPQEAEEPREEKAEGSDAQPEAKKEDKPKSLVDQLKESLFNQAIGLNQKNQKTSLAQQLINQVKSGAGFISPGGLMQNYNDFYNRLF